MVNHGDLTGLRAQVDEINLKLLELLNERATIVQRIGEQKRLNGQTGAFDPKREEQIFDYLYKSNSGPYGNEAIKRIFKQIFDESTKLQEKIIQASS